MIRLCVLLPLANLPKTKNPWRRPGAKVYGFVVRAYSHKEARRLAHEHAGVERSGETSPWLDSNYTSCVWLKVGWDAEVVMQGVTYMSLSDLSELKRNPECRKELAELITRTKERNNAADATMGSTGAADKS